MYNKCYFCLDQLLKLKKESTASFFVNFGGAGVQKSRPTLLYIRERPSIFLRCHDCMFCARCEASQVRRCCTRIPSPTTRCARWPEQTTLEVSETSPWDSGLSSRNIQHKMPLSQYIQNDKIKLSIIQNQAGLHKRPPSPFLLKVCLILENSLSYRQYQFSVQVNSFLQILPVRRKSTWKQNVLKQQFVEMNIFGMKRIEPIV